MSMTSRENLLRTLTCDQPQWIPVCPGLFPHQNPTVGIPERLAGVFRGDSGNLAQDILQLGDDLGAGDCMLPVNAPVHLASGTCSFSREDVQDNRMVSVLTTPKGTLRQVTAFSDGAPSMVTERYVKTAGDAEKLLAYFESLTATPSPDACRAIRQTQHEMGDRGVLFCRTAGTPLGMCYRVYCDLCDLIYLIADSPDVMNALFECMEEKYRQMYACMLEEAPEIDVFLGMDDTSTTLISPDMFERFNLHLTNQRADLCHAHGKLYLHHSCGLIRNLLPVYARTRIDGVDAYTLPPVGDVGYAEGRRIMGEGYSICSGLSSGLRSLDRQSIQRHVAERFDDARRAGCVVFRIGGSHLTFEAFEQLFRQAEALKR